MRKKLLLMSLALGGAYVTQAQLVIPAGGYAFLPVPDTMRAADFTGAGIAIPSFGPNQIWDYSAITGNNYNSIWHAPDGNPNFPGASAQINYSPALGPLTLTGSRQYYLNDTDGIYVMGFESANNTYPIGAISGNPSDELEILNTHSSYGKNYPVVKFPISYQGKWETQVIGTTEFRLTVAGFGLTAAPGQLKQYVSRTDTVIGWGSLTIGGNGMNNASALLVRSTFSEIDSVFLGGAPAPVALLSAFGLTQGAVETYVDYYFYVWDGQTRLLPAMVFNGNATGSTVVNGYYDRAPYATFSVEDFAPQLQVQVFPNPTTGEQLHLKLEQAAQETYAISISNIMGAVVATAQLDKGLEQKTVDISHLSQGHYFVKVANSSGQVVAIERIARM